MNGFLTLIRRDLADNRGALIWTPIILAAVVLVLGLISMASGKAEFGFNPKDFTENSEDDRAISATRVIPAEGGALVIRQSRNGTLIIRTPEGSRQTHNGPYTGSFETEVGTVTVTSDAAGKVTVTTPEGTEPLKSDDISVDAEVSVDTGHNDIKIRRDQGGGLMVDGHRVMADGKLVPKAQTLLSVVLPVGTAVVGILPVGIALIVVLFLLSGSLYDERKDRSVLFWKSMPVSDLQTVGAKLVSIVGIGLAVAAGVGIVLHIGTAALGLISASNAGLEGLPVGRVFANIATVWVALLVVLLAYIGWALPVYAWVLAVSAYVPKAPFIAAFLPLAAVPLIAKIVGLDPEFLLAPASRLVGNPIWENLSSLGVDEGRIETAAREGHIPAADIIAAVGQSLTMPTFWLGLVLAAALVWAASEIRRRKAG